MSYDIRLKDKTGSTIVLSVSHDFKGGTYQPGGSHEAEFNITYNYSGILKRVLVPDSYVQAPEYHQGIRALYGLTAQQSIPMLEEGINQLSDATSEDYWQPTEGNVKAALRALLELGVFCTNPQKGIVQIETFRSRSDFSKVFSS